MATETGYVNYVRSTLGRVRAICECCGKRSRPVKPSEHGEPDTFDMGGRWSTAPYPHDFKHDDGSTGSTFHCPECNARLHAGERLKLRNYPAPTMRTSHKRILKNSFSTKEK